MKYIFKFLMLIRNYKPIEINQKYAVFMDNLKKKYPNDQDLGKFIRNN